MPHEDESERFEVGEEGVLPINNVIAGKHHRRRRGLFECPMERKALKTVCMRDSREHDVRYARVHQVEVGEILDGYGLERAVPGMRAGEVGTEYEMAEGVLVLIEDGADLSHVGPAIVVFRAQSELAKVAESGHAYCVKVPSSIFGVDVSMANAYGKARFLH